MKCISNSINDLLFQLFLAEIETLNFLYRSKNLSPSLYFRSFGNVTDFDLDQFWQINHSCQVGTLSGIFSVLGIESILMDSAQTVQPEQDTGNPQGKTAELFVRIVLLV